MSSVFSNDNALLLAYFERNVTSNVLNERARMHCLLNIEKTNVTFNMIADKPFIFWSLPGYKFHPEMFYILMINE